jgi:hypothetical protein
LKRRKLAQNEQNNLLSERKITYGNISLMTDERKRMKTGITHKQKLVGKKKKISKKIQSDKKQIDLPVTVEIENILLQYNISAAAYHGGKLVDCQELICLSKPIFVAFQS